MAARQSRRPLGQEQEFFEYLTRKREMTNKAARDVTSRCRRIERTLGISLEVEVADDGLFAAMMWRLKSEVAAIGGESAVPNTVYDHCEIGRATCRERV